MKFIENYLRGSFLIEPELRIDDRGFFARYFCTEEFSKQGLNSSWAQINNSLSNEIGTLRGLHFQRPPNAEVKVVRCIQGSIWDVIVDLRENSFTFGKWFGAELNSVNRKMMYVPKGFAHGFITLESNSEIIYLVSDPYRVESEGSLLWSDLDVGIDWPIEPRYISEKDKQANPLSKVLPIKVKERVN